MTLAGVSCGAELGASWGTLMPVYVMGSWHALLGIVEGAITGSVVSYLKARGWS